MASYSLVSGLTGVQTAFPIPFDYLSKSHVSVLVNGAPASFTWTSTYMVSISPAPVGTVYISRSTPREQAVNSYSDGSVLLADNLNISFLQNLFVSQELSDSVFLKDTFGNWNAFNIRIGNVADPVNPQDAANKRWVEDFIEDEVALAQTAAADAVLAKTDAETAAAAAAASATALSAFHPEDYLTNASRPPGHGIAFFDLAASLVGNGVANDTAAFVALLNLAKFAGITKIISSNPAHRYKIIEAELPGSFEFDLGGAGFVADYNGTYTATCATILKTSTESNAYNVTIRNALIDGRNTGGNASGSGGHPLLFFKGGRIELDRCDIRRGANRDATVWATYDQNVQGEVQFLNCESVYLHDSRVTGCPGEQVQIISNTGSGWGRTLVQIERCYFSKDRYDSVGNYWSSSSVVVYNPSKASFIRDCRFGQHVKSALNWFGAGVIERNKFFGVSDSQAIDCNEAGAFGVDQVIVRDNFIQNVINGYAIRMSSRHCLVEYNEINRCQNGIYVEVQGTTSALFNGIGSNVARSLYNVILRGNVGNGNEVDSIVNGNPVPVTNTFIKVKGLDQANPAYVYIEGIGNHVRADGGDFPSANGEYGIDVENCYLFLKGFFSHGSTSLVRMKGYSKFKAVDALFRLTGTGNLLTIDGGTIRDVVFEDVEVKASNWTAGKHVELLNAPTWAGRMYRNRASDISVTAAGIPFTTNYTTTGTTT